MNRIGWHTSAGIHSPLHIYRGKESGIGTPAQHIFGKWVTSCIDDDLAFLSFERNGASASLFRGRAFRWHLEDLVAGCPTVAHIAIRSTQI